MRTLGIIILIMGIVLGIYALFMDTSVQVNYDGNSYGMPERVNNLGLMNTKQNLLIVAGVLSIIGTLILIFVKSNNIEDNPLGEARVVEYKESMNEVSKAIEENESIKENPFETLNKLKESGLISSSEYEEKHSSITNLIEQKVKEDELNTMTQIITNRINKKAQPLIELALKAKNGGLISEQEYESKKKEIIDRYNNEVKLVMPT